MQEFQTGGLDWYPRRSYPLAPVDATLATVDPTDITPLYLQVARFIAEQASGGGLTRGAKLPTERTLCAQFGVSRVTLRRALTMLVEEGVLESSAGRGWFVTTGVLGEPPNALRSFTETARIRGLSAERPGALAASEPASLDEPTSFKIAPGSPVFRLRRVRRLDGVPVACDESRLPLAIAPGLVEVDFTVASLYRELENAGCRAGASRVRHRSCRSRRGRRDTARPRARLAGSRRAADGLRPPTSDSSSSARRSIGPTATGSARSLHRPLFQKEAT